MRAASRIPARMQGGAGPRGRGWARVAGGGGARAAARRDAAAAAVRAVPVGHFDHPIYVDERARRSAACCSWSSRPVGSRSSTTRSPTGRPFLDITSIVRGPPDGDAGGEEGLLSLAFAPDYASSGRFYVCFVNLAGNVEVDEFQRSPALADARGSQLAQRGDRDPQAGEPVPRRRAAPVRPRRPALSRHRRRGNARQRPGADEPARQADPHRPAPCGADAYQVPSNNPYVGRDGRDEIFAYGFRNPWRFAFDGASSRSATSARTPSEEVDLLLKSSAAGANFGWPEYEGNLLFNPAFPGAASGRPSPSAPIGTRTAPARSPAAMWSGTRICPRSTAATSTPTSAVAGCAASFRSSTRPRPSTTAASP